MTTIIDFIMDYECGKCTDEEIIEGFQRLINNGAVWSLRSSYGQMATQLIRAKLCYPPPED